MRFHRVGSVAAAIACVGIVAPTSALAVAPNPASIRSDVALRTGGLLVGEVVDQQGVAKADTPVSIQFAGREVVNTITDANGVFAAKGLRDGKYQLVTPLGASECRLWTAETAPPLAGSAALVVMGNETVRGQHRKASVVGWMKAHPYITAGTVVAAIAIPLALADDSYDH